MKSCKRYLVVFLSILCFGNGFAYSNDDKVEESKVSIHDVVPEPQAANFAGQTITGAFLHKYIEDHGRDSLVGANFEGASINYAELSKINFTGANFIKAKLLQLDFRKANLTNANFMGAILAYQAQNLGTKSGAFDGAILTGVDFRLATFFNLRLSNISFTATHDLSFIQISDCNLTGANFSYTIFNGALVIRSNLSNADMRGISATKAVFQKVDLSNLKADELVDNASGENVIANFDYAEMNGVKANSANFTGANLAYAKINPIQNDEPEKSVAQSKFTNVIFKRAVLFRANLNGTYFYKTNFIDAYLTGIKTKPLEINDKVTMPTRFLACEFSSDAKIPAIAVQTGNIYIHDEL